MNCKTVCTKTGLNKTTSDVKHSRYGYASPYAYGHHGYYGKRSADAEPGYGYYGRGYGGYHGGYGHGYGESLSHVLLLETFKLSHYKTL